MISRPTRHSYSSLSTYDNCPRQYLYSYIEKLDEREGQAASRGTRIHKEAEDYIKGELPSHHQFSQDLRKTGPQLMQMREWGWFSEEIWFVGREWEHQPEDGPLAMIKAVVDLHKFWEQNRVLEIKDLKSGRRYPSHEDQLELYALMGMAVYPEAERVDVSAIYVDEDGAEGYRKSYLPQMAPHYRDKWNRKVIMLEQDKEFAPTPSKSACRWCDFKASKGGPCQAGDMF